MRSYARVVTAMLCVALPCQMLTAIADAPAQAGMPVVRNPRSLRVSEPAGRRAPSVASRMRFEWDPVAGARAYVLSGQWTSAPSWAIHSGEYRVTPRNAATWDARRVRFDVVLPPGNHSWKLVALFGSRETGDFENPTALSFEVR